MDHAGVSLRLTPAGEDVKRRGGTSIGLLAGDIGVVGFVERPLIVGLGWFAIFISIPFLVWGIRRYRKIKRLITEVGTEIFLSDKNPEKRS